jgi:hypothetical protein
MKLLHLITITLTFSSFGLSIPFEPRRDIPNSLNGHVNMFEDGGHIYHARMLSAGLKTAKPVYSGKKLTTTDVKSIKDAAAKIKAIVAQHPTSLVLAIGNSPSLVLLEILKYEY